MDVKKALEYQQRSEISKAREDVVDLAQEMLSCIMEVVEHLKQLPLEERRSPETIQLILELLKPHRESLISVHMIFPHDKGAEAIKVVDSLIARYEGLAKRFS